jgi:hypothetical protein
MTTYSLVGGNRFGKVHVLRVQIPTVETVVVRVYSSGTFGPTHLTTIGCHKQADHTMYLHIHKAHKPYDRNMTVE